MINVYKRRCKNDWCSTSPKNNKYRGYCLYCFTKMFPDEPVSRDYKTKETAVIDFIRDKYSSYHWIFDKKVQDGCSKRRPDALLDLGYQVIIVEVDENQHIDYDCSCENKRLMEISQDLNHRPIVFIRFNPDSYYDIEGKKVKSPWSLHKTTGISIIPYKNKKNWEKRLENLKEQIDYWIENKTEKTLEVIQLFYDQNL